MYVCSLIRDKLSLICKIDAKYLPTEPQLKSLPCISSKGIARRRREAETSEIETGASTDTEEKSTDGSKDTSCK